MVSSALFTDSPRFRSPMPLESIRIRPELRAAQVERAGSMQPALTLYFTEKYDLGPTHLPATFQKVTLLQSLRILATTSARVLEVPEPLWMRFLPKNLVLLSTWKVAGALRRRKQKAVTYAIENNDLGSLLAPGRHIPSLVLKIPAFVLGAFIRVFLDRIAFGSTGAKELYHSLPGVSRVEHSAHEELPSRHTDSASQHRSRVVFVGELDNRKGILDVMASWSAVEAALPCSELTVIGGGQHEEQVSRWCAERPSSRHFLGFLTHEEVKSSLLRADVLLAPSRRSGRWREQIGLPIGEALARGLTIVTTDETGLAHWLAKNGHVVISETTADSNLTGAISDGLKNQLSPAAVQDSLPPVPGRIAADKWLHSQ